MASRGLGTLTLDLIAKIGGFTGPLDQAGRKMSDFEKKAYKIGEGIGKAMKAIAGVALTAGGALTAMTLKAINAADEIRDMSIRLGTSTETLSAYRYAASQTGTDIETLAKGLKVLSKNAADSLNPTSEQAKVFKALGVDVTDSTGKLKDLSQLVPEIADRFKVLEDGTTKAALAQALFGKAGLDLTEFLNQGSQGLGDFAEKARALGIIIDGQTATAADNFNDTLGDLKAVSEGFALHLAKELLPDLQELAGSFRDTATEGNKVKEMASDTADFLRALGSVAVFIAKSFNVAGKAIALVVAQRVALGKAMQGDFKGAFALSMESAQGFGEATGLADRGNGGQQQKVKLNFAGEGPDPSGLFKRSAAEVGLQKEKGELAKRVALALSNPTAATGGKAKESEAEKEAKRLLQSYESLRDGQLQQIALFGQTTEAVKVRYDTEHGELAALDPALKAILVTNAERLDQMSDEADLQRKLSDEDSRRIESFQSVTVAIGEQLRLVGMSADQQEIWNNLKWAGVDADSAWGKQIIKSTQELQAQRDATSDQIEAMDSLREAGSGFLHDIKEGVGIWDAIGNAVDKVADKLFDLAAENLMDSIFGKKGDSAGGSTSGFFSSLLGAFFGGGKASGGSVLPGRLYEVGEQDRPEMLMMRGKQYMIPGNQGTVVPMGGGGRTVNQTFVVQGLMDSRTASQLEQKSGTAARRAIARNGA